MKLLQELVSYEIIFYRVSYINSYVKRGNASLAILIHYTLPSRVTSKIPITENVILLILKEYFTRNMYECLSSAFMRDFVNTSKMPLASSVEIIGGNFPTAITGDSHVPS
jgi:hypothetical protein